MKVHYIAHPIGGQVEENVSLVLAIVKDINNTHDHVVPFAPYIVDVLALDDSIPEQRARGFYNNEHYFKSGFVDVLELHGSRVSDGMLQEIKWAIDYKIPVVSKSEGTVTWVHDYVRKFVK